MSIPTLNAVFDNFGNIFEAARPVATTSTCAYCGAKLYWNISGVCDPCFEDLDYRDGALDLDLAPVELEEREPDPMEAYAEARDRQLWEAHQ